MTLKRAAVVVLGMLVATGPLWARPETISSASGKVARMTGAGMPNVAAPNLASGIKPRKPLPKLDFVAKPQGESRLAIKFTDGVRMRATPGKSVVSMAAANTTEVQAIATQFGLSFVPANTHSQAKLDSLQARAQAHSKKAQPDLSGMMYIEGPQNQLQAAANALTKLDSVEYVYFQLPFKPYGGDPTCEDCAAVACGDCFTVGGNPGAPFCTIPDCCEIVGDIRPFCNDFEAGGEWDVICVALANLYCAIADGADRCLSPFAGNCFEEHIQNGGCEDPTCCASVCALDTFCCEQFWDAFCVEIAEEVCFVPDPPSDTPDLTALQGYLRPVPYALQVGGPPVGLCAPATADFPGYSGIGYNLFGASVLVDSNDMPVPQRYEGLYGLSRELFEVYGVGETVPPNSDDVLDLKYNARGKGIKVAVIEWAIYKNHEDLDLISEPGQTLITILDVGFPDHATACMGIINGVEDDKGITGIAPDADGYFFPLTSVEEGPRYLAAFTSCYDTLNAGDVVSCSFGPFGNLNNDQFTNTLMALGTDLGITTCVAAGNDCFNLDNGQNLGDSGAIVVGACEPGFPYCRIPFSNHFTEGEDDASNIVHISAWGTCITTTGHDGNTFFPNGNVNRSYTNNFGGTSGACPQVAGAVACIQGLAKQFYGIPLMPGQARAIVQTNFPQCGVPNPENLISFDPDQGCGPDVTPDTEPAKIGGYTDTRGAGAVVLNQGVGGFGGSPLIDDIFIIRGDLIYGNKYSIKASDDNYLLLYSEFTERKHEPPFEGPAGEVNYLATGQTVDMMVLAHSEVKVATDMVVTTELQSPGPLTLQFIEMYDWIEGDWSFVGFDLIPAGGAEFGPIDHPVPAAQRFISGDDESVLIRLYVLGLGGGGGFGEGEGSPNAGAFLLRYDWVNLGILNGFGKEDPGLPGGLGGPGDGG